MKTILIPALILVMISCSNKTDKASTNQKDTPRIEGKYPEELNAQVTLIDNDLNPFLANLPMNDIDCLATEKQEKIGCLMNRFPTGSLPMHFGPVPDINLNNNFQIKDSSFIVKALNDTNYYTEEERQYSYYLGVNIPNANNFRLVVIPKWFSVGKSYTLFSISDSGEYIDHLVIGEESSDYESIFGKIESLDTIEVTTKRFGYDETRDLLYFETSETRKYTVGKNGTFKLR